ncbi:MAG: nucleotide modification associated domain-containing protein [Desulfitobacteriaceae bacterium]
MNEFMEILIPVAELLKRKNTDYGNSYSETRREFGPAAFLLRINDKFARLKTLTNHAAQVNDESIEDTIEDNYRVLHLGTAVSQRSKIT